MLQMLFRYNWMIREDWYRWCEDVDEEDLLAKRIGGVRGILHTLFHIIDVEWSWIRILQGKPDFQENFKDYQCLQKIRELDAKFRIEVEQFVCEWDESMENRLFQETMPDTDTWGEVMRHVIAHEIHHIGQLSIWARELGRKPVSANLIGRGLASI